MRKKFTLYSYGLLCSLIIGSLLGGFYLLQGWLIEWVGIGTTFRPVFNACWLAMVGLLIYLTQRTTGQLPKSLGLIRADLKNKGTSSYRYVLLQMVVPAVMLTSGTSLGPEATLVSSTVLYAIWLLDKRRYLDKNWETLVADGPMAMIKAMLIPHRYLLTRPVSEKGRSLWSPLTVSYFAVGILSFYLTCKYGGEPSVIVYLGVSHWQVQELVWFPVLMLIGVVAGRIYLRAMILLRHVILGRLTHNLSLLVLGGVAIYLASLFLPAINFSGMANFHLLATSWQDKSIAFLMMSACLKMVLLTICLNTGWLGGDIFPVLFCVTAQGIALSQVLPIDPIFVIGVLAISMGGTILASPLVAGGVMSIMFLPPNLLPVGLLATATLLIFGRIKRHLVQTYGNQYKALTWL